jgi:DNA replication protein DnaC
MRKSGIAHPGTPCERRLREPATLILREQLLASRPRRAHTPQPIRHPTVIHNLRHRRVHTRRLSRPLSHAYGVAERTLTKLARYDAVILDDLGYVQQSREEMEVLFTFLAERYEKRTVVITSNLVFSQWDQIFKDPMTTMAAIDRLVHHATILEFTGESHRLRKASKPAA